MLSWLKSRKTFRARVFWSFIPIVLLLFASVALLTVRQQTGLVEREFVKRGLEMARTLAHTTELGVLAEDEHLLMSSMRGAAAEPDVSYVLIYADTGELLASAARNEEAVGSLGLEISTEQRTQLLEHADPLLEEVSIAGERSMDFIAPILCEEASTPDEVLLGSLGTGLSESGDGVHRIVGFVRLGLSLRSVEAHVMTLFKVWGVLAAVFLVAATLAIYAFSERITRPIKRLTEQARKVASGSLDEKIPVTSRDEIGQLATAFNEMGTELKRNIGEKERLLAHLRDVNRTLEERTAQLEVADRHKSQFLANMSHELRTPLNAIIGFSEVLLEKVFGRMNEKQEEYLTDIFTSGRHLLQLINEILDLAKIEAGRVELELSEFELPLALEDAAVLLRGRAQRHAVEFSVELDQRLGTVTADQRKLKQILINLLSNAIKFTPDGGKIALRAALVDGLAEISVADTGAGIAPEDQARIFQEFIQVGGDYTRKAEGTGLGLTLAQKFVEMHGGRIWVESELGRGSKFTFTIPIGDPEAIGEEA